MKKSLYLALVFTFILGCSNPSTKNVSETSKISYSGDHLKHLYFPIGGIGTGNMLLGGRGEIHELEIFNRAHRDEIRPYMTFFSLWAKEEGKKPVKRILERKLFNDFPNGFGVPRQQLAGMPRFTEVKFHGQYPVANLIFIDDNVPLKAELEAFNPYIPLDTKSSSMPVAIMKWKFTNTSAAKVDFSVCFNMGNPFKNLNYMQNKPVHNTVNQFVKKDEWQGVMMSNTISNDHHEYGNLVMFTTEKELDVQTKWYRGGWWDDAHMYWNDFSDDGRIETITKSDTNEVSRTDVASLLVPKILQPGESVEIPFYLAWYVPNRIPETTVAFENEEAKSVRVKNHYALGYSDAGDVASELIYALKNLEQNTKKFHQAMQQSTLPKYVIDAASANLAIMKTNVFMQTGDGHYHGFEGIGLDFGCCAGNCTHVYNYAQTIASIFPSIERDVRETAFLNETFSNGYQSFRTVFPVCDCAFKNVAADGQMGNIMRVYREWKFSGDNEWLEKLWPKVKLALEFAWNGTGDLVNEYPWMKNCPVPWDPNKEGVLRGDQHNTYDINFFGPNMMTGSLYLGALKACSEMAAAMNEPAKAKEYQAVYESGLKKYNELLWNGDYYIQKVELIEGVHIPGKLKSPGSDLPKYQYGEGCLADQLLGQYLAYVSGLGNLVEEDKIKTTMKSIFEHNFIESFRDFENVQRVYALNNEAGMVICTWPKGNREPIPFPYADEVWTGVEYQVAASLIYAGLVEEGLKVTKAVRGRYNGSNRNPYAEIESGYYYARAMSSWAVLMALSGFEYDGVAKSIKFDPKINSNNFFTFWSTGTGWGTYKQTGQEIEIKVEYGSLSLNQLSIPMKSVSSITLDENPASFTFSNNTIKFNNQITINHDQKLSINP